MDGLHAINSKKRLNKYTYIVQLLSANKRLISSKKVEDEASSFLEKTLLKISI